MESGCRLQSELRPVLRDPLHVAMSHPVVPAIVACVKPELLVIADQHAAVNTFPGLVHTARHTTRVVCTRSRRPNPQGAEASKVWRVRGVKS